MKERIARIYADIDMRDYVNDQLLDGPTLSSSIANVLIERSPRHAYAMHPRFTRRSDDFSRVANFGSAVASMVFGGPQIMIIDASGYTTKLAKESRDLALETGQLPLLTEEWQRACNVSDAAREAIARLGTLDFEQTIIFPNGSTWCRSRPDAISRDRRLLVDLKVTGINARECNRHFFSQGYDMQAAFMERGADSIDPDGIGKRVVVYLFVEADFPHGVVQLQTTEATMAIARRKMNAACNLWSDCIATGIWPLYDDARQMTQRPSWDETSWLVREETDGSIKSEVAR
jgi:hypothetical protein